MLNNNSLGILLDNLKMPARSAILKAAELGVQSVQLGTFDGELDPLTLRGEKAHEFSRFIGEQGLSISAILGDVGGFKTPEVINFHIAKTKRMIDMAVDLGCNIVTGHIGAVPMCPAHHRYGMMRDALAEVGEFAAERGAVYAIETGPETSWVLRGFLTDIGSKGLGVNMDPANMVMITGENPASAVRALGDLIVHTHMKDGRQHWFCPPDIAYGMEPDPQGLRIGHRTQCPIGQGDVEFPAFLAALEEIGYTGALTIEREAGDDRATEMAYAVQAMKALLNRD